MLKAATQVKRNYLMLFLLSWILPAFRWAKRGRKGHFWLQQKAHIDKSPVGQDHSEGKIEQKTRYNPIHSLLSIKGGLNQLMDYFLYLITADFLVTDSSHLQLKFYSCTNIQETLFSSAVDLFPGERLLQRKHLDPTSWKGGSFLPFPAVFVVLPDP